MHRVNGLPYLVAQHLHGESALVTVDLRAMHEQPRRLVHRDEHFVAPQHGQRVVVHQFGSSG
jgi:hypothetical protein